MNVAHHCTALGRKGLFRSHSEGGSRDWESGRRGRHRGSAWPLPLSSSQRCWPHRVMGPPLMRPGSVLEIPEIAWRWLSYYTRPSHPLGQTQESRLAADSARSPPCRIVESCLVQVRAKKESICTRHPVFTPRPSMSPPRSRHPETAPNRPPCWQSKS